MSDEQNLEFEEGDDGSLSTKIGTLGSPDAELEPEPEPETPES